MQQELAEAGVAVVIETVDSATLFAGMADGKYDMAIASHTPGALPLWFTASRFAEGNNIFHVADLTPYTDYISAIQGEADQTRRQALVTEFQAFLARGAALHPPVVQPHPPRPVPHGGRHRLPLLHLLQRERVGLGVPGMRDGARGRRAPHALFVRNRNRRENLRRAGPPYGPCLPREAGSAGGIKLWDAIFAAVC